MTILIKPSDTVRTNTITLAADPYLQFTMLSNRSYLIRAKLWVSGKATPDFKICFDGGAAVINGSVGINGFSSIVFAGSGGASGQNSGPSIVQVTPTWNPRAVAGSDTAGTRGFHDFEMCVKVGGTGGVFSIFWAQNTIDAVNSATMHAGSSLEYFDLTDSSILAVVKSSDESRTSLPVAVDSQLVLALDANTYYWVDMIFHGATGNTFARDISYEWKYTGTVQAPTSLYFRRCRATAINNSAPGSDGMRLAFNQMPVGETEVTITTNNAHGGNATSGILHTNAAGNLEFWWHKIDNGGSPGTGGTVYTGSCIVARPITDL